MAYQLHIPTRRHKRKPKRNSEDEEGATNTIREATTKLRSDGTTAIIYKVSDFDKRVAESTDATSDSPNLLQVQDDMSGFPGLGESEPYYGDTYNTHKSTEDDFHKQFLAPELPSDIVLDKAPLPKVTAEMLMKERDTKTQTDYLREFVTRVRDILPATLAHEYLDDDQRECKDCPAGSQTLGIWRCADCFDGAVYCRCCMRKRHMSNPFHRIQCWLGTHFRPAVLWEVGVYLVIPHHLEIDRKRCGRSIHSIRVTNDREHQLDMKEQHNLQNQVFPAAAPELETEQQPDLAGDITDEMNDTVFEKHLHEAYKLYKEKGRSNEPPTGRMDHITEPMDRREHRHDPLNLQRVVHTNGIHHIHVVHCSCNHNEGFIADFVAASLIPASFQIVKTFFTTQLLDFSRLCNLELKCSAYQFHQLLQRMTCPLSPGMVKSIYNEFRRMCRLWRWLKKLKWAGFGHNKLDPAQAENGQFALFCAACPQPGINLPPEWEQDPTNPVYGRTFVADGNFKADHVQQTGEDVPLYDGAGMMPNSVEYKTHIASVQEIRTKAACDNNFRAIEKALTSAKACDITGVVGIACARHGCYCPNGMVDLQKGEQQKNVDYAFVKSLQHTNVDIRQKVTLLYDIACQYSIHLRSRIDHMLAAGTTNLRELVIDRAIGLFHVHAHKDQCFFRFSPTFIPGLGTVAGEILESLWSTLNEISISMRTASLSYRAETLDDHATDSNHKKMLNMAMSLATYLDQAVEMAKVHKEIFDGIDTRAKDMDLSLKWQKSILEAEKTRMTVPEVMDIYGVDKSKVESNTLEPVTVVVATTPVEQYFEQAINIEGRQLDLRHMIKRAGETPSPPDLTKIANERESLQGMVNGLSDLAQAIEGNGDHQMFVPPAGTTGSADQIEYLQLHFASNGHIRQTYSPDELKFRIAQCFNQLNIVRELIVEKSMQYSHIIRIAKSKAITTRARQKLNDISDRLDLHCKIYGLSRVALTALKADSHIMDHFKPLARSDLNATSALLLPNSKKSTEISLSLSWIWRSRMISRTGGLATEHDKRDPVAIEEFLRVHWLRARALSQRWSEEESLLSHEMEWTVRFYGHKVEQCRNTAQLLEKDKATRPAAAYSRRKRDSWLKLASEADILFKETNSRYKSPLK